MPPDRLLIADEAGGQAIALVPDGARTIVRVTRPGAATAGAGAYDMIEEGWRSFFQQLRPYLERHPNEDRRTMFLEGDAAPAAVLAALQAKVTGRDWRCRPLPDRHRHG